MVLLLRFYLQLFRVPAYNQLSRFLFAVTDFIVRPARRVIRVGKEWIFQRCYWHG